MNKYDIAAFIWPSYTGDEPRTRIFWPNGCGEWQTVMDMTDKGGYDGCRWPRKPLWGYVNEADKSVMEMQIKTAVEYGVNVFIYDWYWYDDRPFLENCLNDGFLKADNNKEMKFYLMWANHDATHLWDKRNSSADLSTVIWRGTVTPEIFDKICDRTIDMYFKKENYYLIDGCPVYMIFDFSNFIRSFENVDACRKAVQRFRDKTAAAGFKGLHLQLAFFGNGTITSMPENDPRYGLTERELMEYIGFDSFTNYNWACNMDIDRDFAEIADNCKEMYNNYSTWSVPYYPNVTVGWDNNVRFKKFVKGVMKNNTPEEFEKACHTARNFSDLQLSLGKTNAPLITVNSWNEWTETSYLEPDDLYGYGYLEAIKRVFK